MHRNWLAGVSTLLLVTACGDWEAPTISVDEASEDTGIAKGFSLDYEKFELENGLDVILHVDKSDPIVAFSTVVHVGSNREKPGRTGFAHFFEHMAFNDSENVPRGWNRKAIPEWGGQRNGGTWSDGTIYFEVVPKDAVDKILWIDSDRLGFMINTVTQAALEREKQVVKNEKRQRVDNAPYGFTTEVIKKALYPADHPYNWTVIGQLEDLQAATLDDLKKFYEQYYGAANITLAIAGDFDPAEMKQKVEYWFSEIRRGPAVERLAPRPVQLEESANLYFEDNFAKLPELRITYPSVESLHKDEIALSVLGGILGGSKGSPLYDVIVNQEKLAPSAASYNGSQEIAGEFTIRVRANPGTDLDDVKAAIDTALARFEDEGVDPRALQRIKAEQETGLYGSVSTVLGKANQLARSNEFAGDPAYAATQAALLDALTTEDVVRVYETYIKDKPAIFTSFVPKGSPELALEGAVLADVFIEEVKSDVASEEVSQGALADYEKTPSQVDRSEPPFGELPLFKMPGVQRADIKDSVTLFAVESSETPLVTFDVSIHGGRFADPAGQIGRSSILASLMNEGTADKTAAAFEEELGLLGSSLSVSAGMEDTVITVTTLSRNFEATAELLSEVIQSPRFDDASLEKVRARVLTGIKGRQANPNALASDAFSTLLYGEDHPAGATLEQSEATTEQVTLADLEEAHADLLKSSVRFHLVGDVEMARAESVFTELAELFQPIPRELALPSAKGAEADTDVFFIDVPGSKQSVIQLGKLVPPRTDDAHRLIRFTNEKLGGGISADLSQTLRIEKGYTYGAYSSVTSGSYDQVFRAVTSVRANATGPSLEIIKEMIQGHGDSFTDEAAEVTKQKIIKDNTRAYESLGAKLGMLRTMSRYGLSSRYLEEDQAALVAMTADDFRGVAKEYLDEDEMIYVVVGDGETQREALKTFAGGVIVELPGPDGE